MTVVAGFLIAAAVGVALTLLGVTDARTQQVPVRPARSVAYLAIPSLALVSALSGSWERLAQAAIGAILIAGLQALPYLRQQHRTDTIIGKADLRLSVPFGWTLGWFGIGFATVGFAAALLTALAYAAKTRTVRVPFIPALAAGYWLALTWALLIPPWP